MDWGEEGLTTTRDILKKYHFQPIGTDLNLEFARHPAIIECNEIKLGFLGYAKKGQRKNISIRMLETAYYAGKL